MAITPGVSFSPISSERTLEDLPALLARLFGGPSEGTGVRRLPRLLGRGVPPDEILKQFLSQLPQGDVTRPDITEVFAPEQPAIVERPGAPLPGAQPVQTAPPDLFAGPIEQEPEPTLEPEPVQQEPSAEPVVDGPEGPQEGFPEFDPSEFPQIPSAPEGDQPTRGAPYSGLTEQELEELLSGQQPA